MKGSTFDPRNIRVGFEYPEHKNVNTHICFSVGGVKEYMPFFNFHKFNQVKVEAVIVARRNNVDK